jgi:signal transduction histidine kinase
MSEIRPPYLLAVTGVVLGVGALTAVTLWGQAGRHTWGLDVVVAAASLLTALAQLRWPTSGALAATLLATLSPVATPAATLGALQVAQLRRFRVAAAAAAAGIAAHLVQGLWRPYAGISLRWWLLLMCAAYGALLGWGALAQRSRRALLTSMDERARRAEAEQGRRIAEARMAERRRLAREMHDVLAHRLSLVATHAGALEYRPDSSPDQLARAAGVVRAGVRQALEELRQVINLLREQDDQLDELEPRQVWPTCPG